MAGSRIKGTLAAGLMLLQLGAGAEDIDLFMTPASPTAIPNLLIILDNTSGNWGEEVAAAEVTALKSVLEGLATEDDVTAKFNVGVMLYSETGTGNDSPNGAYVRAAIRSMDSVNKTAYAGLANSLTTLNDNASGNTTIGLAMSEAYRYFAGASAYAGHNKAKRDYTGNLGISTASDAIYALTGNALTSSTAQGYTSPITGRCQNNFVIYISNGPTSNSDNETARTQLSEAGGNTSTALGFGTGPWTNIADEWARFMAQKDHSATLSGTQNVKTYTVDVAPGTSGQGPNHTALLRSMAYYGLGRYFSVRGGDNIQTDLTSALNVIFSEVIALNSVYASASLPVSVNTQGTYLNQVFIGMFRPDVKPRWDGNLKQYQFKATDSGGDIVLKLADKDNSDAINSSGGFITPCAKSFWTPDTVDSYWNFSDGNYQRQRNTCASVGNSSWSNTPDGALVERGAAGHRLRQLAPDLRNVKTCTGDCTTLANFNDANEDITAALLDVDTGARTALINWVRGADVNDGASTDPGPEKPGQTSSQMRPSAHGDVVHSRPLAIDYGGSTGVVVYYGANDGALHAINGNQTSSIGSYAAGDELWSFIAPEHFDRLKRLKDNTPVITLTGKRSTKDYFFDGPIGAYRSDDGHIWIYPTMRRGGRMLYAFDVSSPGSPSLKWKRGCPSQTNNGGCDTGFTGIGQTWSKPTIVRAKGYDSGNSPLIIMGGGHDECEDEEPNNCTSPKGNQVYVLDADDGSLLATLATVRGVVGDVTPVDTDGDGYPDYAYAADTGGNLYRIAMGTSAPADWTITQIAALGCATPPCAAAGAYNRKFMHAPGVVVTAEFNAVLIGTGDREHPLLSNGAASNVTNAFYMVKDKPANASWLSDETGNCNGEAVICMGSLLEIDPNCTGDDVSCTSAEEATAAGKGWYLDFSSDGAGNRSNQHTTEQVVTSAVVVGGVAYFSTHLPPLGDGNSCGLDTGLSRAYAINFLTAIGEGDSEARYSVFYSTGLPPSPVAGVVLVDNPNGEGQLKLPFIIGAQLSTGSSPLESRVPKLPDTNPGLKTRVWWYMEQ